MTIHELRNRKEELCYTYRIISVLSGVSEDKVKSLFEEGENAKLSYKDRLNINRVLTLPSDNMVQEDRTQYGPRQGIYTVDDYLALPDDVRVELIDGVFYGMASPTTIHQLLVSQIGYILKKYIDEQGGKCITFFAPLDTQLDCDNKTMIQPDIMIICDRDNIHEKGVMGAPDFVVEILSPSSKRKDTIVKLEKYKNAGVREYWLIDPMKQRIVVFHWEKDSVPLVYGFQDIVPVGIFDGKCVIDFKEIEEQNAFLYK